jgi:DNA-binding MarR family transcriptional regulator
MDTNHKAVLQAMKKAGKPLRPGEIAELTGFDKDDVTKVIKQLQKEGLVISPKKCYYQPE